MHEVTITPVQRLKLGVDWPLIIRYAPEVGLQVTDSARLHLRLNVLDPTPLDQYSTEEGTLTLTVDAQGVATVTGTLLGERSQAYPLTDATGMPRLKRLSEEDAPTLTNPEDYRVLPVFGTLIVTSATGVDRVLAPLDFRLLMEASYVRE